MMLILKGYMKRRREIIYPQPIKELFDLGLRLEHSNDVYYFHQEKHTYSQAELIHSGKLPFSLEKIFPVLEKIGENEDRFWGLNGIVVKRKIWTWKMSYVVAVKFLRPYETDISGLEQYVATRLLQSRGVLCAEPYLATELLLASKWIDGSCLADADDVRLQEFTSVLKKIRFSLISEGVWDERWKIEGQPSNFIINNLNSKNVLDWFTVIDPIYVSFKLMG